MGAVTGAFCSLSGTDDDTHPLLMAGKVQAGPPSSADGSEKQREQKSLNGNPPNSGGRTLQL